MSSVTSFIRKYHSKCYAQPSTSSPEKTGIFNLRHFLRPRVPEALRSKSSSLSSPSLFTESFMPLDFVRITSRFFSRASANFNGALHSSRSCSYSSVVLAILLVFIYITDGFGFHFSGYQIGALMLVLELVFRRTRKIIEI